MLSPKQRKKVSALRVKCKTPLVQEKTAGCCIQLQNGARQHEPSFGQQL